MFSKTKKLVMASLMAALVCVATMIIKIPSPLKGYLNLGDGIVLLAGWMLLPGYGFLAAGLGSALADLFLSYITYAPATFVIKGTLVDAERMQRSVKTVFQPLLLLLLSRFSCVQLCATP